MGFGYFNHRPPLGSCPNGGGVRVCVRRKPPLGSCVCAYNKSIIIIMHAAAAGAHTAAAAASPLIYMSDKNKKCVRTYVRVCARALVRSCARARESNFIFLINRTLLFFRARRRSRRCLHRRRRCFAVDIYIYIRNKMCVRACVRACARARVHARTFCF